MNSLWTKEGKELVSQSHNTFWNEYPRPQMMRGEWQNLNGEWTVRKGGAAAVSVRVPYPLESLLSGYEEPVEYGAEYCFSRTFTIPEAWKGKRVLLHFGAVSRVVEIYVNGEKVGTHDNSYLAFTIDITKALAEGENRLEVRVVNDISHKHPWGKQKI
ncbi:MAG: beta-galactosidase, partial [Firmicutes bacterium]|nr:beta-galactosidase [Bacillota bacterium]